MKERLFEAHRRYCALCTRAELFLASYLAVPFQLLPKLWLQLVSLIGFWLVVLFLANRGSHYLCQVSPWLVCLWFVVCWHSGCVVGRAASLLIKAHLDGPQGG